MLWDSSSALILQSVNELVSSAPVLRLFDLKLPVTVSFDASPYSLGAVLLQNGQPIEFASRSLTDTQRRYAQIKKELLAVQFGMTHFHHYVCGNQVTLETDVKPLVGLVDKPLGCVPHGFSGCDYSCRFTVINFSTSLGRNSIWQIRSAERQTLRNTRQISRK